MLRKTRLTYSDGVSEENGVAHEVDAAGRKQPHNMDKTHLETPQDALASWAKERDEEMVDAASDAASALDTTYPYRVAHVIFQANTPWSTTVWIDIGNQTKDGSFCIQKNCPVLDRDSVVGIVDFVGKNASRVRLLPDPCVRPAVRVVRESVQVRRLVRSVQEIQKAIASQPTLLPKPELATALSRLLDCLLQSLPEASELRLAKGELQGAEYPSSPTILRGEGFNYEFDDDEGPKRDLRTGQRSIDDQKVLLIKPGDLLETSGLDGVFPRGLRVATVASVSPLEEGAVSYRILAKIDSPDFPNFDHLTVIPAQPSDPLAPPSDTDRISHLIDEGAA
jgi:hypothetical protein